MRLTASRLWRVFVLVTLAGVALAAIKQIDPLQQGLTGEYFFTPDRQGVPVRTRVDVPPFSDSLTAAWDPPVPSAFGVRWTGGLLVLRDDTYTFATTSDDGSHVMVDGVEVVNNGGAHGPRQQTGSVKLHRGVHRLTIDYDQQGGGLAFELRWARGGRRLELMPPWILSARYAGVPRFLVSWSVWIALEAVSVIWLGLAILVAARWIARRLVPFQRLLEREGLWPAVGWIVACSIVLNVAGISWGLPGTWPAAELTPTQVLDGWQRSFAHGWFHTYPPVHFYVLTAVMQLVRGMARLWPWVIADQTQYDVLYLSCRAVSVAFGAGIVAAAALVSARVFGRRAGVFGGTAFALVLPFVYYAKTANTDVPYLFWFAVSMVFYLRVLESLRLTDFLLFASAATLSVCTKDQAYGLYALMPVPIVYQIWRLNRCHGARRPLLRACFDRRLWAAALCAAVLFALSHNLLFNLDGFRSHVRYIVGPGSEDYRVFDQTLGGHVALLRLTAWLLQQSFGWPITIAAAAGVIIALASRTHRSAAVWLLVPAISYYVGFLDVVLYAYDRFVLPICFVLAPFAGLACDRVLSIARGRMERRWIAAGIAAAFAYTVFYAATVDVLMTGDSRYSAERWLAAHVQESDLVAYDFGFEYLPRMDALNIREVHSIAELLESRPAVYVLNMDYARAIPRDSPTGALIDALEAGRVGYHRAAVFRRAAPWPWLPWSHHDLTGPRHEARVSTILRNVNPTIALFIRDDR
jgi:hypothetical protein